MTRMYRFVIVRSPRIIIMSLSYLGWQEAVLLAVVQGGLSHTYPDEVGSAN